MNVTLTLNGKTYIMEPDGENMYSCYVVSPNSVTANGAYSDISIEATNDENISVTANGATHQALQLRTENFITVRDRTQYDVEKLTEKGTYTFTDLNRVNASLAYITLLLSGAGYVSAVSPRRNWTKEELPTAAELEEYLANVAALQEALPDATPALPAAMEHLDYIGANNIEQIIYAAWQMYRSIIASQNYCGELYLGEVI